MKLKALNWGLIIKKRGSPKGSVPNYTTIKLCSVGMGPYEEILITTKSWLTNRNLSC